MLDRLSDPYDQDNSGDYYSSIPHDLEIYGKMVVKECIAIIHRMRTRVEAVGVPPGYDYESMMLAYNDCMDEIAEEFDVTPEHLSQNSLLNDE